MADGDTRPVNNTEKVNCITEFQYSNPVYDTTGDLPDAKTSPEDPVYIYFAEPPSTVQRKAPPHKVEFIEHRKCSGRRLAIFFLLIVLLIGIAVALYFIVDVAINNQRIPSDETYNAVRGNIRILDLEFTPEYTQSNSMAYQLLAKDVENEIESLFLNSSMSSIYSSCRIIEFGSGSLIVYFELLFKSLYDSVFLEDGSTAVFEEGIRPAEDGNSYLGIYLVDTNSIQVTAIYQETSSSIPVSSTTSPSTTSSTSSTSSSTSSTTTTSSPPESTFFPVITTRHVPVSTRWDLGSTNFSPFVTSSDRPMPTSPHIPVVSPSVGVTPTTESIGGCETIYVPQCLNSQQVPYTQAFFPNIFGQSQAQVASLGFLDDVISSCSYEYTAGFLCSLVVPKCGDNALLTPCKSYCEEVFSNCGNLIADYLTFTADDCATLPDASDDGSEGCLAQPELPMVPIRLSMGAGIYEGRLEIFYGGDWGTVCDQGWDETDVYVVCQQLGYEDGGIARPGSYFGAGYDPIWLTNISCVGNEEHLAQCEHAPWGEHTCTHEQDVGVTCFLQGAESSVMVRLGDSDTPGEGRLDVYYGERWGTVCTNGFGPEDINVVCSMMGYNSSGVLINNTFGPGNSLIWLDQVQCVGNETNLAFCLHGGWGQTACGPDDLVAISCTTSGPPAEELELRLVGGPDEMSGRVEVLYSGVWGTICDDNLHDGTAQVLCRMMGYNGEALVLRPGIYGIGTGPIWIDQLDCDGSEASILECDFSEWGQSDCTHDEDATIACSQGAIEVTPTPPITPTTDGDVQTSTLPPSMRVRLTAGENDYEGTVEVLNNATWGTICDDGFTDAAASVICRTLGITGVARRLIRYPLQSTGPVWLDNLECQGDEESVFDCSHSGWGETNCDHNEDVYITCNAVDAPVRLADGSQLWNGRVEILHNGEWGTVCDDWFDHYDAIVLCRSLGYNSSIAEVLGNQFGPGSGTIWLESLRCTGSEVHVTDCRHDGWGQHNCVHDEDISIACQPEGAPPDYGPDFIPCEPIEYSVCADNMPYEGTGVPNLLGHASQILAEEALLSNSWHHFMTLCPSEMLYYTCAMVFPECNNNTLIRPCRSLCEEARDSCLSTLLAEGYEWPMEFSCDDLPEDLDTCFDMSDHEVEVTYPPAFAHCEPIQVPICDGGLSYNTTEMPNLFGQASQAEAIDSSFVWTGALSFDCHPLLRHFLCAMFTPECRPDDDNFIPELPCQSVCLDVKLACEHTLFDVPWPDQFDCNLFPVAGTTTCLTFEEQATTAVITSAMTTAVPTNTTTEISSGDVITTMASVDTNSSALPPTSGTTEDGLFYTSVASSDATRVNTSTGFTSALPHVTEATNVSLTTVNASVSNASEVTTVSSGVLVNTTSIEHTTVSVSSPSDNDSMISSSTSMPQSTSSPDVSVALTTTVPDDVTVPEGPVTTGDNFASRTTPGPVTTPLAVTTLRPLTTLGPATTGDNFISIATPEVATTPTPVADTTPTPGAATTPGTGVGTSPSTVPPRSFPITPPFTNIPIMGSTGLFLPSSNVPTRNTPRVIASTINPFWTPARSTIMQFVTPGPVDDSTTTQSTTTTTTATTTTATTTTTTATTTTTPMRYTTRLDAVQTYSVPTAYVTRTTTDADVASSTVAGEVVDSVSRTTSPNQYATVSSSVQSFVTPPFPIPTDAPDTADDPDANQETPGPQCEFIQMEECRNLSGFYNYTLHPNSFGFDTQEETIEEAKQYIALSNIPCSQYMQQFVCSILFPKCDLANDPDTQIRVCQHVCSQVEQDCTPLLVQFGMTWPDWLNCDSFPVEEPCYDPAST